MTFTVANVISAYNSKSGGPPRTVTAIAAAGRGHWRAELFTTDYQEPAGDSLLVHDFPGHVNVLPSSARTTLGGLSMYVGINRAHRSQLVSGVTPDVVHIHGMWSPYLASFALEAQRARIPYVVAPHGMLEPWSLSIRRRRKAFALRTYQGAILANAAVLHATSALEADHLRSLRLSDAPIFVVPNAVEEPEPGASPDGAKSRPPDGPRVMLFLSRVHEKKGLDILLQAWSELRPTGWRLRVVGSGEESYVRQLRQFCEANRLAEVEFVPHLEGAARETAFRDASVFVLPTYSENFGNVVAEALVRGLPVITTTGTPWSDIVPEGCGWYIEPTLDQLRQVIAEATRTDPAKLSEMGSRGRDYARTNFTLEPVREKLLGLYDAARRSRVEPLRSAALRR